MAGRPTEYKEEYNEQVVKLCRLGATDKEIADFFDVTEQTINNWKSEHPLFFESIKKGKVLADAEVADKLFKRATGYSHDAVKIFPDGGKDEKGNKAPLIVPYVEHYPPDTVAAIFWLKNRRGKVKPNEGHRWADKQEITGEDGLPLTGPAVILQMPAGTNISLPDNTEEPDNMEDEGSPSIQE
jgi:DNA-binding XRE family transcriptional regulator